MAWAEGYLHTKWYLDPSSLLATMDMGRKLGAVPLLGRGARSPSSAMWPGPRPTFIPNGILIHPAVWPQGPNIFFWGGGSATFWEGELEPHLTQCRLDQGTSLSLPSAILIHPVVWQKRYGPKIGGYAPLREGELGPHLTQCGEGRGLPARQLSS